MSPSREQNDAEKQNPNPKAGLQTPGCPGSQAVPSGTFLRNRLKEDPCDQDASIVMLSRIGWKWQQNWSRNMETCADFLSNFRRTGRGRLLTPAPPVPQSSPPFTPISPPHLTAHHPPTCTGLPRTIDQRTECTLSSNHTVLRTAQLIWSKVSPPLFVLCLCGWPLPSCFKPLS